MNSNMHLSSSDNRPCFYKKKYMSSHFLHNANRVDYADKKDDRDNRRVPLDPAFCNCLICILTDFQEV